MIDRYFDAVDLNNTEIYIEWETPKSKATGTVTKSVSEPYLKVIDDENYYGKLIFGWALSEAITKDSGTLKFAVRFIQRDNQNKIVYSFNTLTSQVTIHPNLGTDMATAIENADNCNARLLERIQESEVVGGAKAKVPYFLLDLVILEEGYDIEDNHTDGSYTLYAVATADDTGAVSYVWRRGELNPDNSEEGTWVDITEGDSLEMIPLTEEELIAFEYKLPVSRVYHIGTSADDTTELDRGLYDLKASFTDKNQPIPTIYERRACLVVTEYGLYKAEARNRIFNSLTKADSNTVIFKRPDDIVMVEGETTDKHIIGVESAILNPQFEASTGDHFFQWYRASKVEDEFAPLENIVDGTDLAKQQSYIATEPGFYQLVITRIRNRAETTAESIKYRVTNAPVIPEPTADMWAGLKTVSLNDLVNEEGAALTFTWDAVAEADGFEVDWFLSREIDNKEDLKIITQTIDSGDIVETSFNPADSAWVSIFEEAKENVEGFYYAVVRTKLNGEYSGYSTKPELSTMFSVID